MKITLIIIFSFISFICYSQNESWELKAELDAEINDIAFENDTVWIATNSGLMKLTDDSLATFKIHNSEIPDNIVLCVRVSEDGTKWIGTETGGLVSFKDDWEIYNIYNSSLSNNRINELEIDSSGIIWLLTGEEDYYSNELITYDGRDNWKIYDFNEYEQFNNFESRFTSMSVNKEVIWIGGNYGLFSYNFEIFEYHSYFNEFNWLEPLDAGYICIDSLNQPWFTKLYYKTAYIISYIDTTYRHYDISNYGGFKSWLTALDIQKNNNHKWFSLGILSQLVEMFEENYVTYQLPGNSIVTIIKIDKNGNKWIGLLRNDNSGSDLYLFNENGLTDHQDDNELKSIISVYILEQNYPNPFNLSTTIQYSIPTVETGHAPSLQQVTLVVYDVLGRKVVVLVNEQKRPGNYEVIWDAKGQASGVYYYRIDAGEFVESRKMLLLK